MRPWVAVVVGVAALLLGGCWTVYENEEDANDAAHGREGAKRGESYHINAFDVMDAASSWDHPPK